MNVATTTLGRPLQRSLKLSSSFTAIGARLWMRILGNAKVYAKALVVTAAKMQQRGC